MHDFITIVSGLPRSGTSLMMQMLAAGGLSPLTDQLREPDDSNPRGYFEFEKVKQLRSDQSWLEEAGRCAVKIIHVLLRELPLDRGLVYRVILMRRPLVEVLASQRAMLLSQGKAVADDAVLEKIYTSQLVQAEEWLTQSGISFFPVEHHQLLADPLHAAEKVNEFLGGHLDVAAMAAAVDPALHRQRQTAAS